MKRVKINKCNLSCWLNLCIYSCSFPRTKVGESNLWWLWTNYSRVDIPNTAVGKWLLTSVYSALVIRGKWAMIHGRSKLHIQDFSWTSEYDMLELQRAIYISTWRNGIPKILVLFEHWLWHIKFMISGLHIKLNDSINHHIKHSDVSDVSACTCPTFRCYML